jgi:hypothetical protein
MWGLTPRCFPARLVWHVILMSSIRYRLALDRQIYLCSSCPKVFPLPLILASHSIDVTEFIAEHTRAMSVLIVANRRSRRLLAVKNPDGCLLFNGPLRILKTLLRAVMLVSKMRREYTQWDKTRERRDVPISNRDRKMIEPRKMATELEKGPRPSQLHKSRGLSGRKTHPTAFRCHSPPICGEGRGVGKVKPRSLGPTPYDISHLSYQLWGYNKLGAQHQMYN